MVEVEVYHVRTAAPTIIRSRLGQVRHLWLKAKWRKIAIGIFHFITREGNSNPPVLSLGCHSISIMPVASQTQTQTRTPDAQVLKLRGAHTPKTDAFPELDREGVSTALSVAEC